MSSRLVLDNHRVYQFYINNPHIDFETANLFFVDLFEKFFHKDSVNSQNITQTIENLNKDNFNSFISKLVELRKDYIEDLNNHLHTHTANHISPIINNFNQGIHDKFKLVLNDKVGLLENKIEQVVDSNRKNMENQVFLNENVSTLIKKMENSSIKGAFSENLLYNVLLNLFSNADIVFTNQEAHHGDILLKRKNKIDILFENKDYNYNVPKKEIDKFIEDINLNNCSGILLSQKSGIALKDNFEIEIHKGNVIIFLHHVNYSTDIINTAIHIIDHLHPEINVDTDNTIPIDKNTLQLINIEYKNFAIQRIEHIESIKIMSQRLIKQAEELRHPSIENLLNKFCNTSINKDMTCVCGKVWASRRSLASHQKQCERYRNAFK